jgi:hypothetical protein
MDLLKLFKKRYNIGTTATGPSLIKFQKENTWSEKDIPDCRGKLLSPLEHPFFSK